MAKLSKWQEIKRYFIRWPRESWGWRVDKLENIVDDPVDNVKHWLHGRMIFGYRIRLPKWLMQGSGRPDK